MGVHLKKVLPILLSVAMTLQCMPLNAYADELPTEEIVLEEAAQEDESVAVSTEDIEDVEESSQTTIGETEKETAPAELNADVAGSIITDFKELDPDEEFDGWYYDGADGFYSVYTHLAGYNDLSDPLGYTAVKDQIYIKTADATYDYDDFDSVTKTYLKEDKETVVSSTGLDSGKYFVKLEATKTGVLEMNPIYIPMEIRKAVIKESDVYLGNFISKGAKVSEAIDAIKGSSQIKVDGVNRALTNTTYFSKADVEISKSGAVCAADEVFNPEIEYSVKVSVALTEAYAKNYELPGEYYEVVVLTGGGYTVNTDIKYTQKASATSVEYPYTGEAIAEPIALPALKSDAVEVQFINAADSTVITPKSNDTLTGKWLDDSWDDLEEAPVDAGTYYYKVTYHDINGYFEEKNAYIKVEILPIHLYLKPEVNTAYTYFADMEAYEVTSRADYKLYEDEACTKEYEVDRATFWDTSYADDEVTQPYTPVFELVKKSADKAYAELTETEKETLKTSIGSTLDEDDWLEATDVKNSADKYVFYTMRYAGRMAVYGGYTEYDGSKPAEDDYSVAQPEPFSSNYIVTALPTADNAVKVNPKANATIDVSEIVKACGDKGDTIVNRSTKIYDKEPIFAKREEYKKATAKAADGSVIDESKLRYSWEYGLFNEIGGEWVFSYSGSATTTYAQPAPYKADGYRLAVNLEDTQYTAETKYVYFEIVPQSVVLSADAPCVVPMDLYTDTAVYKALDAATLKKLEGNAVTGIADFTEDELQKYGNLQYNLYSFDVVYCDTEADKGDITKYSAYSKPKLDFVEGRTYKIINVDFDVDVVDKSVVNTDYGFTCTYDKSGTPDYTSNINPIELKVSKTGTKEITVDGTSTNSIKYDGGWIFEATYNGNPVDIVPAIKFKDGTEEVALENVSYSWSAQLEDIDNSDSTYYTKIQEAPTHAGEYSVVVSYPGNDTYKGFEDRFYLDVYPRELTVTPVVSEDIHAGVSVPTDFHYDEVDAREIVKYISIPQPEGVLEGDKDVSFWDYWSDAWLVHDHSDFAGTLQYGEEYTLHITYPIYEYYPAVRHSEDVEYDILLSDYQVIANPVTFKVNKHGSALVDEIHGVTGATVATDDMTQTIKAYGAVEYDTYTDINGKDYEGNYISFRINTPAEYVGYKDFADSFLYKESIANAGGIISNMDYSDQWIEVLFDASALDQKTFEIAYQPSHVEKFVVDLTGVELIPNYSASVAPKALKFNKAPKAVAVGEEVQLDVDYKKFMYKDIVTLNYEVDDAGKDFLYVNEKTGNIVGLKAGSATVTVYPVRKNAETGKIEKIEGAKTAKAKIKIKEVDTPKIKKIEVVDDDALITYAKVKNGFRREIYAAKGKKDEAYFEAEIAKVVNNNYAGTDIINLDYADERVDKNAYVAYVDAYDYVLEPNTLYTFYVRNVSGLRAVDPDGKIWVTDSHAGSAKFATTKKPHAVSLDIRSADPNVSYKYDRTQDTEVFFIPYTAGGAKMDFYALFDAKYVDPKANSNDKVEYQLPIADSVAKNTYDIPKKLLVTAFNPEYPYAAPNTPYHADNVKSKIITCDSNGNLKIKGAGYAILEILDPVSGKYTAEIICVTAKPTRVEGKDKTLRVGEVYNISKNLTFSVESAKGETKVPVEPCTFFGQYISDGYTAESAFMGFDGSGVLSHDVFYMTYSYCTAVKSNASEEFTVTLRDNPAASTKIKLSSTTLGKVSGIQITDILDYTATVSFKYADNAQFLVTIKDEKRGVEASKVLYLINDDGVYSFDIYSEFGATFAEFFGQQWLSRLSTYSVTITPVIYTQSASTSFTVDETGIPVTKSFKTIDIPASYRDLDPSDFGAGVSMDIYNVTSGGTTNIDYMTYKAGNLYVFQPDIDNDGAKYTGSDTLIWSVSDSSVAAIKANPNTNTITFMPKKRGYVTLEVRSKLTQKVIARYHLSVRATENAGNGSWLDYIFWT